MPKDKRIKEQALPHGEHQEVMPFISEDSVQDRLLVLLAIACGIALCILLSYWLYLPKTEGSYPQGSHKMAR